jgi:PAS domain S-box-containing protein
MVEPCYFNLVWVRVRCSALAHSQKEPALGIRMMPPDPAPDSWLAMLDHIPDAVLFLDTAGRVTFCNEPGAALFNMDSEAPSSREWGELIKDLSAEWSAADPYPFVLQTGKTQSAEVPLGAYWYSIRVSPFLAQDGHPGGAVCLITDVTESRGVLTDLRRSEETFRALVENSPDWISRLDRESRILYANPALENAFGIPTGAVVGRIARHFRMPDEVAADFSLLARNVFELGKELVVEHGFDVRGERRYLHTRVVPEIGRDGSAVTALTVTRDITEGRTIRDELARMRETNKRQRDSLEQHSAREKALGAVVMEINAESSLREVLLTTLTRATQLLGGDDGSLFLLDPNGKHMRGVLELEHRGCTDVVVVEVDDWPPVRRASETGKAVYFTLPETEGPVRDWFVCREIWGSLITPLVVNGRCIGLVFVDFRREGYQPGPTDGNFAELIAGQCALAIDRARVHEECERLLVREREARNEAERQAGQMEALFRGVADGVAIIDSTGRMVLHNDAAVAIIGGRLGGDKTLDRYSTNRVKALDGTVLSAEEWPVFRALRGEPVVGEELLVERADGSQVRVASSAGVVRDESGKVALVVMTFRDVTALRRLERAKDDFLQVLAHELRNPLAAAMGLVQLVTHRLGAEGNPRHTEHLSLAESELKRLNDLINEIVVGYRVSEGRLPLELKPTNLVDVLTNAIRPYALRLLDHKLIVSPPPVARLPIIGDAKRLTEIVANLLSNAIKYSPAGRWIWVSTAVEDQYVVVRVEDEGIGIPPDQLERVFEGFYRATNLTNRQPGGLGLGLFISRDVAKRHGGDLWAENRPGGGTTMCLKLPLAAGSRR